MDLRPGRPRSADVARAAGVSKTAVSFAFNSPERLSPETASRIRGVADTLGYRPHPVARMLTRGRTMTIGVLTPQALSVVFSNPFFGAFSEGVAAAAEEFGLGLHFISPLEGSLASAVGRATVDGVVAIGLSRDHPEVEQIRRAGVPMVFVDSTAGADGRHGSVEIDDEGGARAAARHLLGLGHREFLVLGVEPPAPARSFDPDGVTGRRLRGYRAALLDEGIELPDTRLAVGPASVAGGLAATKRALEGGVRPTAILAMSDAMAIGVLRALHESHLAVPGDVSVVGFDDIDLAAYTDPSLTTVHQPIRRKGEEAVRLLVPVIEQREPAVPEHVVLETRLVIRASTGPLPTGREEAR